MDKPHLIKMIRTIDPSQPLDLDTACLTIDQFVELSCLIEDRHHNKFVQLLQSLIDQGYDVQTVLTIINKGVK